MFCVVFVLLKADGAPVLCSHTNQEIKLKLSLANGSMGLIVEDYRGLPFSLLCRSSSQLGANPWNDVEGVSSDGMHWPSAVRYLPINHPLRTKFKNQFKEDPSIQRIWKMKPPFKRTTQSALECAEEFKNGTTDAEFMGVSQFYSTASLSLSLSFFQISRDTQVIYKRQTSDKQATNTRQTRDKHETNTRQTRDKQETFMYLMYIEIFKLRFVESSIYDGDHCCNNNVKDAFRAFFNVTSMKVHTHTRIHILTNVYIHIHIHTYS